MPVDFHPSWLPAIRRAAVWRAGCMARGAIDPGTASLYVAMPGAASVELETAARVHRLGAFDVALVAPGERHAIRSARAADPSPIARAPRNDAPCVNTMGTRVICARLEPTDVVSAAFERLGARVLVVALVDPLTRRGLAAIADAPSGADPGERDVAARLLTTACQLLVRDVLDFCMARASEPH